MNNELTKAEQNALSVSYDVMGTHVDLDIEFAKKYLVRGQPEKVTNQELVFFLNTCKMQKLNPLVAGEVYCIKFGNEPAQMVVGKGAYLRRAFEHPDYLCKEDGIVVQRGNDIVQKEGCCLYPGERLIGGWCRVHFVRSGKEHTAYKEVALSEYDKGQANWKTKPATMIDKVAVSQCVREAFPKDYEGLYSEEEMIASGAIPADYTVTDYTVDQTTGEIIGGSAVDDDPLASDEQKKKLYQSLAQICGDKNRTQEAFRKLLDGEKLESSVNMTLSQWSRIYEKVLSMTVHKEEPPEDVEGEADGSETDQ